MILSGYLSDISVLFFFLSLIFRQCDSPASIVSFLQGRTYSANCSNTTLSSCSAINVRCSCDPFINITLPLNITTTLNITLNHCFFPPLNTLTKYSTFLLLIRLSFPFQFFFSATMFDTYSTHRIFMIFLFVLPQKARDD